jgi:hypothetical protein
MFTFFPFNYNNSLYIDYIHTCNIYITNIKSILLTLGILESRVQHVRVHVLVCTVPCTVTGGGGLELVWHTAHCRCVRTPKDISPVYYYQVHVYI